MARVIVVEDDASVRDLIASSLRRRGHDVLALATVRATLEAVLVCPPDLLVVDVGLPDASGLDLVARFRDELPNAPTPVIVVSALSSEFDLTSAFAVGATDYIVKPFTLDQLQARCAYHLGTLSPQARPPGGFPTAFGKYSVRGVLGSGSHGTVYDAQDERSGQDVALKVLDAFAPEDVRLRFLREIYTLSSLRHERLPAVVDFGGGQGRMYCAMRRVDGPTLRDHVLQRGPLGESDALDLLAGLGAALEALAGAGVVHRDIKPANVVLEGAQAARPALVDFGLAKRRVDPALTDPDVVVGTPGFMAPEVIAGGEADVRSDLFSLGRVALFALAGALPFPDQRASALLDRMTREAPPLPAGISPGLAATLAGLTRLDPATRTASPTALLAELARLRGA